MDPYSFELLDLNPDFVNCYKILRKEKKLNYTFDFFSDEKKINFNVHFGADPGGPKTYGSYRSGSKYRFGTQVKSHKEFTNSRNQVFSYYFCLTMEGSGAGSVVCQTDPDADPGGPKIYESYGSECGSGSTTLV
jgi:hypothetical protein